MEGKRIWVENQAQNTKAGSKRFVIRIVLEFVVHAMDVYDVWSVFEKQYAQKLKPVENNIVLVRMMEMERKPIWLEVDCSELGDIYMALVTVSKMLGKKGLEPLIEKIAKELENCKR